MLRGNGKLGTSVATWSMSPGKISDGGTCPVVSTPCNACYAQALTKRYKTTKAAWDRSKTERLSQTWSAGIIKQIKDKKVSLVRIHVSGDFDATWYIDAWIDIIKNSPNTTFWAYTRAWKNETLLAKLRELAVLPNCQLWLSTDQELGLPPSVPCAKVAYLSLNLSDTPKFNVDLVFRAKRNERVDGKVAVVRRLGINNARVCPVETGADNAANVTCSACKICFTKQRGDNLLQITA